MSDQNFQYHWVEHFDGLQSLRGDWNRLYTLNSELSPFQAYDWNEQVLKHFKSASIRIGILKQGGRVIGIFPLVVNIMPVRFFGSKNVLSGIGVNERLTDYYDFLLDPEVSDAEAFPQIRQMFCALSGWDRVDPGYCRSGSVSDRFFRWCSETQFKFSIPAPFIRLDESIYRSLQKKESPKRHQKKLEKEGVLQAEHIQTQGDLEKIYPVFVEQYNQRWIQGKKTPSGFQRNPAEVSFFYEVSKAFLSIGMLRFFVLKWQNKPVGFHLGFERSKTLYWYKPSFEFSLSSYSPGEVLLRVLFQECEKSQIQIFDFTIGDEPYKYRFSNATQTVNAYQWIRAPFERWIEFLILFARNKLRPLYVRFFKNPKRR